MRYKSAHAPFGKRELPLDLKPELSVLMQILIAAPYKA
jgi:hypothetical protein